ncbi:MAG TPA: hypothetical protein PKY59_25995 [Pyrinomonadaceae bacterium]|nr:hypothetical protein [Pyrinomonadaceae bacterium]
MIAWIVSGLLIFLVFGISDVVWRFSSFSGLIFFVSMYVLVGFGNLASIFGVLYIRSRENDLLLSQNSSEVEPPNVKKTLQATFAVYFLTLLMIIGSIMAMTDIDERYFQPKQGNISFGIYD